MAHEFRYLFTPIRVGGLTLRNRIFSTGHAEAMAEEGKPGPRLRAYHEGKARGGCALTIIGGSSSVHPSSPASAWNMPANHDDSIIPPYRAMAEAIHRHDCLVFTQLTHMGRRSQSDNESWHVLLAPSQIPEKVHREIPHEMDADQIAMIVRAFGDAVRRSREGGLDGVELSFAHNHLVDQFWSPIFNQRTDEYGGSLDNRMRFGLEVLQEIRRQVGRDYVVGARISGDEFTDGGLTAEDMGEIAHRLAASGLVDFLSIIGGAAHTFALQAGAVPNMSLPNGVYVPLAAAIKAAVPEIPIFHATRIVDPVHADQILADGSVDVVGMTPGPHRGSRTCRGRPARAAWTRSASASARTRGASTASTRGSRSPASRIREPGRESRARASCRRRRRGSGSSWWAAASAASRRRASRRCAATRSSSSRKGGSWAGRSSSPPARPRGPTTRGSRGSWCARSSARASTSGCRRRPTRRRCSPSGPTWSSSRRAPTPTCPPCRGSTASTSSRTATCSSAAPRSGSAWSSWTTSTPSRGSRPPTILLEQGRRVEVISRLFYAGQDVGITSIVPLYTRLFAKGVVFTPHTELVAVEGSTVVVANVYTGEERRIEGVDTVVLSMGARSTDALYRALRGRVPALHAVGDCVAPRGVHHAILEGTRVARLL